MRLSLLPQPNRFSNQHSAILPVQFKGNGTGIQQSTILPNESASNSLDSFTDIFELPGNRKSVRKLADELAWPVPKTLSTAERVKEVEQFALKLFQECQTADHLLKFAKMTGTPVYSVEREPWIKNLLPNANGIMIYPRSLMGLPTPSECYDSKALMMSLGNPQLVPRFMEIDKKAETEKFPYILLSSDIKCLSPKEFYVFQHELFHLIQNKKGLHAITENEQLNLIAVQIIYDTLQKLSDLKTAWPVIADLSKLQAKQLKDSTLSSKLSQQFQSFFKPADSSKTQMSVGQAIRQRVHREMENYKFFIDNAQILEVPQEVIEDLHQKYQAYQTIELYSHKYD